MSALVPNKFGNFTLTITERDPAPPALHKVTFDRVSTIHGRLTRKTAPTATADSTRCT